MKLLNDYRMRLMLFGFAAVIVLGYGTAKADFTFGEPTNLGPTINSSAEEFDPSISTDGLELYFHSLRTGGYGNCDLWVAVRASTNETWAEPVNLGADFNTSDFDGTPCISADSLTLYFSSRGLPGGIGKDDIWVTTRPTKTSPWGAAENLGPIINTSAGYECHPYVSVDELCIYFANATAPGETTPRPGGYGGGDIWVSTRATTNDEWREPQNLGATVNSSVYDAAPCISADGLMLFFHSDRTGGYGSHDIWVTRRKTPDDPWEEPLNLGTPINTSATDAGPALSGNGKTLYFVSGRDGGSGAWDLWQVPIIPIVDFNGDGIVDSADMCIMVDQWGTDDPLCDIGPMPWGDGIVDVQDLIVLSEHFFVEPGLVAHWKLDETEGNTAYDSIVDNDGMVNGEPVWQPEGGMVDGALQFDGIDDYVRTDFVLNPADGAFSVFSWIKASAPGQVILSQADGVSWLCTDSVEGCLLTDLTYPSRSSGPLLSQRCITDGQWHRIGLVWDGFHRRLYVDGVEVAKDDAQLSGLVSSDGGLYLGTGNLRASGTFFSGLIDDIRIYNRVVSP